MKVTSVLFTITAAFFMVTTAALHADNNLFGEFIAHVREENPRLKQASDQEILQHLLENPKRYIADLDQIIAQLEVEHQQPDQSHRASDAQHIKRAFNMIREGFCKGGKGVLIIGWIGGKWLVSYGGQLLHATTTWVLEQIARQLSQEHPSESVAA